jgi:hypothetical protein
MSNQYYPKMLKAAIGSLGDRVNTLGLLKREIRRALPRDYSDKANCDKAEEMLKIIYNETGFTRTTLEEYANKEDPI